MLMDSEDTGQSAEKCRLLHVLISLVVQFSHEWLGGALRKKNIHAFLYVKKKRAGQNAQMRRKVWTPDVRYRYKAPY